MVVSVAVTSWYFGEFKEIGSSPILRGFGWGLSYHLGSIAAGSLFLVIIRPFRLIFHYLHNRLQSLIRDNKTGKQLLKSVRWLVSIFGTILRRVNKHAFTDISMRSSSYFDAAQNGFKVVNSSSLNLGIMHSISELVFLSSQLFLTSGIIIVAFITLSASSKSGMEVEIINVVGFITVCLLLSWISSNLFCSIWSIAASALVHCYCIDEEFHKFDGQGPKFASDKLQYAISHVKAGQTPFWVDPI